MSTVGLVEIELPDGSRRVLGSGSGDNLSPIQKRALEQLGIQVVNGPGHAEQNLAGALPPGSKVIRWGIAWAGGQRPDPCDDKCAPIVKNLGGVIER